MAKVLNDMILMYRPEIMCPQLAAIKEPALKDQQYYKYLMDVFYKHVNGHMVEFGEYFKKYGDYYKSKLLECASKVNRAASALSGISGGESPVEFFKRGVEYLKASRPADALTCLDKASGAGGQFPDLQYARAVALLQLDRLYDARQACYGELDLQKDHEGAKKLLEKISQSREACKIG
jgi:tetratricopeptide (TPR) repeat protein